jgi:hypothetical protein
MHVVRERSHIRLYQKCTKTKEQIRSCTCTALVSFILAAFCTCGADWHQGHEFYTHPAARKKSSRSLVVSSMLRHFKPSILSVLLASNLKVGKSSGTDGSINLGICFPRCFSTSSAAMDCQTPAHSPATMDEDQVLTPTIPSIVASSCQQEAFPTSLFCL